MPLLADPAIPDIALPDGTFMHGPLLGSQEPRFRTVPARHRVKDPDCRACRLGTDYTAGCGDYKSAELLPWAARFGYDLDPWQVNWLEDACGTQPDGRWAAFECLCICCRQNGKNQDLEVRELGGLFLFGESLIIHTAHEFKASREHFRRVSDTINGYNELRGKIKSISTSHGEEAIELRPKPTLIFGSSGRQVRKSVSARLRFLARSRGSGRSFTADCFSGDTRYWTRDGLRTLAETAGTVQEVLAYAGSGYGGAWCKAEIRAFGERELWAVTLRRNKQVKVIRATAGHRWLVRDSRKFSPDRILLTGELHAEHKLAWRLPKSRLKESTPSPFGIAHGITFGDGSRDRWGAKVQLYGEKDAQLLRYFPESQTSPIWSHGGIGGVCVRHLPFFFKDRPPLSESVPYLYGWLAGYFAADGCVGKDGLAKITSVRRDDLEFVQLLAARLGIGTYGIRTCIKNDGCYGVPDGEYYDIQFVSSSLQPNFFLIAEHRRRYEIIRDASCRNDRLGWTVVSAEPAGEVEETFCAVVPEHENFVLEDWINVGNCVVYDEAMILSDDQVGASMPTMRAVPNPQLYYTASAGMHDSTQLAAVRRRMIHHDPTLMGYEWSISPHTDLCPRDEVSGRKTNRYITCARHDDRDDPRAWAKSNPAFGTRIRLDHFRKELAAMGAAAFDRELLGVGDWPPEEEAWEIVTEESWRACSVPDPGGAARPVAFAWDVAEDLLSATIASAWIKPALMVKATSDQEQEMVFPERVVLEIPRGCSQDGTAWVIPRLVELKRKWKPIAVCAPTNGPGASLIDDAEKSGIEVLKAGSADEAAALALLRTGVRGRGIAHLGKEQAPAMWTAVATATTRDVGDGGKALKRRDSESDITPATTAALANWALNKRRRNYDPLKSVA